MHISGWFAAVAALAGIATAQYFPPFASGMTKVEPRANGVSITYKQTRICETTPGVKAFSGYVHFSPGTLEPVAQQNYSVNIFFWYFEARKDPTNAPLSMWLNGGPGTSSMAGALTENGPCFVNPDSKTTTLNPFSWNNEVNMLYIDQPNQVGFSYDTPTNVTLDTFDQEYTPIEDFSLGIPQQNNTFYVGTAPSQDPHATANNTMNAARTLWQFTQVWFQEFPEYQKCKNDKVSLWAESYGGKYAPAFASLIQQRNQQIKARAITDPTKTHIINLDTVGIVGGCIDSLVQMLPTAEFAYNNTYNIKAVNETTYKKAVESYKKPGGCRDLIENCRSLAAEGDPEFVGNNDTVNAACGKADQFCQNNVKHPYFLGGRSYYDITRVTPDIFPGVFFFGYLNQYDVMADLGAQTNYTPIALAVPTMFMSQGDYVRGGTRGSYLNDLANLLDAGVKIAFMYGDRDYVCNWVGGEQASLAINYTNTAQFHAAGYTNIQSNATYIGGQVRQYGNFSFSRVFQAGHMVPSYQPETAYEIFQRVMFNRDVATGLSDTARDASYATTGSPTSFQVKNEAPPIPAPTCYVLAILDTCTEEHAESLRNGTAVVRDYILVDKDTKHFWSEEYQ
ncbi:hypothetical protein AJ80_02551 [Polytolypa hystricis UAMH7299]|uniref:Carboxypeptidase n=1 Tax=Polytolypa hystricis (strain UAMH7299) TaxID=1447883 RepID=A0A2B7YQV8_POLH7|nr:hypothetical protein AJ80_02551 [Polytolypa hystricis UAMH7299]